MEIKDIPWYNRPGARLKKKGVGSLSDAGNILELNSLDHVVISKDNFTNFIEKDSLS